MTDLDCGDLLTSEPTSSSSKSGFYDLSAAVANTELIDISLNKGKRKLAPKGRRPPQRTDSMVGQRAILCCHSRAIVLSWLIIFLLFVNHHHKSFI